MQALRFKNFTDQDFTWKYDGVEYTFKAGDEMFLEDFKAHHFAKHLVDRELNRLNKLTNSNERAALEARCFGEEAPITPESALDANEKGKRKKKVKDEVEFEDLKPLKKK